MADTQPEILTEARRKRSTQREMALRAADQGAGDGPRSKRQRRGKTCRSGGRASGFLQSFPSRRSAGRIRPAADPAPQRGDADRSSAMSNGSLKRPHLPAAGEGWGEGRRRLPLMRPASPATPGASPRGKPGGRHFSRGREKGSYSAAFGLARSSRPAQRARGRLPPPTCCESHNARPITRVFVMGVAIVKASSSSLIS